LKFDTPYIIIDLVPQVHFGSYNKGFCLCTRTFECWDTREAHKRYEASLVFEEKSRNALLTAFAQSPTKWKSLGAFAQPD